MRTWVLWLVVIAGLAVAAVGATPQRGGVAYLPTSPYPAAIPDDQLIALATTVGDQYQQLIVVDPKRCAVAVYRVELASGAVELRSVRNISSDLELSDYNGKSPLPAEIRSQLQSR